MVKYNYPREGRQGITRVQISKGNTKLGNIPGFAMLPGVTCRDDVPCLKHCYAVKYLKRYPRAVEAYMHNTELMAKSAKTRLQAFTDIMAYLKKWKPKYFRIHVAGDFISQEYLDLWFQVAIINQDTRFITYTKKHDLNFSQKPDNFNLYLSVWENLQGNSHLGKGLPIAYTVRDLDRLRKEVYRCAGQCQACMHCYKRLPAAVAFQLK